MLAMTSTALNTRLVGKRLRDIRQARGLSQTQLAIVLGINLGNYNEIEHAKRASFQVTLLYRLAHALEVSTDYLLGLTDDPTPHWTRQDVAP